MEKTFDVEIITPDRVFYKGTADLLEFNTESGEIGVYRDHIPLTTVLEPGLVTIHHGDEEQVAAVHAGFAEILGDKVTLLAELAEWPEEIDLERAEAARERAEERIHNRNDNLDLKRAEFALHKALIRINLGRVSISENGNKREGIWNILPLLWTFTPEFGTIVVVSLYTNEEILCTGRIKTIG